ncbi:MAG TPA: type IV secretion system protein [Novosphingobium sp.]|nr:type IV secretion system protein [Novosphingobium sp.]
MGGCAAFSANADFASAMLHYADCRTLALAQGGWQAFAPGGFWGPVLWALLTLAVAAQGWRMLLGQGPDLRSVAGVALRIGVVLALATQWSAWQAVVFDAATRGPEQVAQALLAGQGAAATQASLAGRIDATSKQLAALVAQGQAASPDAQPPLRSMPRARVGQTQTALSAADASALNTGRMAFAISSLSALVALRTALAALLAVGPVFAAFGLFGTTLGLCAAWARSVFGVGLALAVVPVLLVMALGVIEPQTAEIATRVDMKADLGSLPQDLCDGCLVLALALFAALAAIMATAKTLAWPARRPREASMGTIQALPSIQPAARSAHLPVPPPLHIARAHLVAQAAQAMNRRDMRLDLSGASQGTPSATSRNFVTTSVQTGAGAPIPLGQNGRCSSFRSSLQAGKRDGR